MKGITFTEGGETNGKEAVQPSWTQESGLIKVNYINVKDTKARADDRRKRRVAFRLKKACTDTFLELMTKKYKDAAPELDETAFQPAVPNEKLKRKEKELEERLTEVTAFRSLLRQEWDPREKLTCLLPAVRNQLRICQEIETQKAMRRQGADLDMVRRMQAHWL